LAGEQPCQGRSEAEPVRVDLMRLIHSHYSSSLKVKRCSTAVELIWSQVTQ
jgi:hypothetical protein